MKRYSAVVEVLDAEHHAPYWKPVPNTEAASPEEALRWATEYAANFWPWDAPRRHRFLERCKAVPV